MATLNRRGPGGEQGQAIVELALTLPLLLLVVLGVFDFGLMFQRYEVITNAAREGARVAVLPEYSDAEAQLHAENYLAGGGITGAGVLIADVPLLVNAATGKTVIVKEVTVRYVHQHVFVGPIMALFGGATGSTPLTAISRMRREGS